MAASFTSCASADRMKWTGRCFRARLLAWQPRTALL